MRGWCAWFIVYASMAACGDNTVVPGALWNGRPPQRAPDMTYDHVRCLADQTSPTCGATFQAHWRLVP